MTSPSRSVARALLFAVVVVVLAACGGATESNSLGYIPGEGVVETIPPASRSELPRFEGATLDGGHFDTADHAGKVLVINVWGSWCPPCRKEAPGLQRAWSETRDRGVQFVGIDIRDNDASARAFERKFGITYPSITSADSGPPELALSRFLPQGAVPSTVIVDRSGKVAARVIGRTTYITLRDLIDDALAEG